MQQTSWINEAHATLKDQLLRAIYLLKLKGLDVNLVNETTMDAAFLMQQIVIRERLENIQNGPDPLAELDLLAAEINTLSNTMLDGFAGAYNDDRLEDAREWIRKLQFLQKAKNEINILSADIEDELMS